MPVISGRTWNHNGSRRWPGSRVLLINESDGVMEQETVSNGVGWFRFVVPRVDTVYTLLADADDVRAGARSGIVAGPDLVTVRAEHVSEADAVDPVQVHILAVVDSEHAQEVDGLAVVANLTVDDSEHAQIAEDLAVVSVLMISNAEHAHESTDPDVVEV